MEESMNKKLFWTCAAILIIALIIDPAYCGITSEQIKAASKSWSGTIKDWSPMAIGGGLSLAGVMFFMNKYAYALGAVGGTAFLYGAQAFVGDGQACLIDLSHNLPLSGISVVDPVLESSRTSGYAAVLRSVSPKKSSDIVGSAKGLISAAQAILGS
jgi:hypothetical protein